MGKSAQQLFDLVKHPPFSTENSKIVGAQKVPHNFWIGFDPTPPSPTLMENTQIKAAFF